MRLALAASGMGDWSWNRRDDVVTLSPRATAIFAVPVGTLLTRAQLRALLHAEDSERVSALVDRAVAEHADYSVDYRLVNGGRERWVWVSGRGRFGERGEMLGIYGVVQEITNDRLLVRVDDAVRPLVKPEDITYTAARILGQHLGVNRCAYAFVEDDEDTFTLTGNYNDGVDSIVGRYRFRQFGAACLRSMRAGEPYVVHDSARDPRIDEEDRKAYASTAIGAVICVPICKSGRFVAAMAVHMKSPRHWSSAEVQLVQQVASRCWESIERARVEREREGLLASAEAANRTKDEFLAMLGHELRNPLAPIQTALHLMQSKDDGALKRERTVIERQVDHLTRLVDDLLDVSRIAQGKVELKYQTVELADVVTRAIEIASPLLEQHAHTLELDLQRSGLPVNVDPARLTQVVSNLLSNAAKYTPAGGRIAISTVDEGERVSLRVRDNGVGISPEIAPRVFDLFVQGRQSIDRAQGGLGLGLTIVRSLVERHGGSVSMHSKGEGLGSEFAVRLPRARMADIAATPPIAPPLHTRSTVPRSARVLVVDDNEDAAEMLAAVLSTHGCEVSVAHDGPEALRIAAACSFDAALLDIGLPVMDGYELAGRLRELPNLARARLVAVTGYGQESDRQRALAAGFQEHLVKPVDLTRLKSIVSELLNDDASHSASC
ncbi:MAG TPA: ATP-binding protein [Polyangiales bacterium]|nr:ATP-binding protein [Polyangiales bacterium]